MVGFSPPYLWGAEIGRWLALETAVPGVMVEFGAYWVVDQRWVELTAELRTALVEVLHQQSLRLTQQQYQVFLQLYVCIQH